MDRIASLVRRWIYPAAATLDLSGNTTDAYITYNFHSQLNIPLQNWNSAWAADQNAIGEDFRKSISALNKDLESTFHG